MTIQYLNSDEVIRQYTKQINNIKNTNTTYKQNVNQIINAKKPGINKLEEARKREEAGASSENKDLYLAVGQPPVGKELLFPDQFFNIPNPSAPYVDVQFRTAYSEEYELDNPLIWESATTTKRNFFNQLSIEDTGLIKLNLSLIDMNFAELEGIINKTILNSNFMKKAQETTTKDTGEFSVVFDNKYGTNLRLRFGYAFGKNNDIYIDESTYSDTFKNRKELTTNNKKTCLRTPWLYFQIIGLTYNVSESGLMANITALEVKDTPLKSLRFIRKNSVFISQEGNVSYIKDLIYNAVKGLFKNNIEFVLDDGEGDWSKLKSIQTRDEQTGRIKSSPIKILLGDKGSDYRYNNGVKNFGTIDEILTEFCSQIQPKFYTSQGQETTNSDKAEYTAPFSFSYASKDPQNKKLKVMFGYIDRIKASQAPEYIRAYEWREPMGGKTQGGKVESIVTNFSVSSSLDFAQLNAPIFNLDEKSLQEYKAVFTPTNSNLGPHKERNFSGDYALVGVAYKPNSTGVKEKLIESFRNNLNRGIFSGEIEIPGDPFYLFDEKVQPYQYGIYVYVNRNGFINIDNKYIPSGRSYLSGYYLIKKINHEINNSGFTTKLEIERFPLFNKEAIDKMKAEAEELTKIRRKLEEDLQTNTNSLAKTNYDKARAEANKQKEVASAAIQNPKIQKLNSSMNVFVSYFDKKDFGPAYQSLENIRSAAQSIADGKKAGYLTYTEKLNKNLVDKIEAIQSTPFSPGANITNIKESIYLGYYYSQDAIIYGLIQEDTRRSIINLIRAV